MATHVYTLLGHQFQRQNLVNLQQGLNGYALASQVIFLPYLQCLYPKSIGTGHLLLPKDWLRLELNPALDEKVRTEEELTDLPIIEGLALEISVYKSLMIVKRYAGEKWNEFILDPIGRLILRKDVQALANFLGSEQVVYLPGGLLPELEAYTLSQLVSELQSQKCQIVAIQAVAEQVQSYRQIYQEEPEFYCISPFAHPVTLTQLQSLANLQLAILTLALEQDELDYLKKKDIRNQRLLQQLETHTQNYWQWVTEAKNNVLQELTQEQLSLIDLLSEELTKPSSYQPFWLSTHWKELPCQEFAEDVSRAFAWEFLDLADWFDKKLENEQ